MGLKLEDDFEKDWKFARLADGKGVVDIRDSVIEGRVGRRPGNGK